MPFQISYSTRQKVFSQVTLITAGDDQLHVCSPTVQLNAIVVGNLNGHTIEWEQLTGASVTIVNGNTLSPSFDINDDTDKEFRIYIDRGTPFEQFDDVLIGKTPASSNYTSFNNNQQYFMTGTNPSAVETDDIIASVNVTVPPPTSIQGEELGSTTIVNITWQHPTNTGYQPYIAQYKVVENTLVVDNVPDLPISTAGDGLGLPSDTLSYDGTFADYRIDTYYNIAGVEYVRESETKPFSTLTVPLVKAYNDNTGRSSFNPNQQYLTRTNYTNLVNNESSSGNAAFNPNAQEINITRYDPSGIGSG